MKNTEDKHLCFVIMPFGGHNDTYYKEIYAPAIRDAGLEPKRADELYYPGRIIDDIWNCTKKARLVLADLTGRNPNVLYELGLAHAIGKQAILITESPADIPFDLKPLRHLIYDKNIPDWGDRLKSDINSAIKEIITTPHTSILPIFLDNDDLPAKPALSTHEKELLEIKNLLTFLADMQVKQAVDNAKKEKKSYFEQQPLSLGGPMHRMGLLNRENSILGESGGIKKDENE